MEAAHLFPPGEAARAFREPCAGAAYLFCGVPLPLARGLHRCSPALPTGAAHLSPFRRPRAWSRDPRLAACTRRAVDARVKPAHDEWRVEAAHLFLGPPAPPAQGRRRCSAAGPRGAAHLSPTWPRGNCGASVPRHSALTTRRRKAWRAYSSGPSTCASVTRWKAVTLLYTNMLLHAKKYRESSGFPSESLPAQASGLSPRGSGPRLIVAAKPPRGEVARVRCQP